MKPEEKIKKSFDINIDLVNSIKREKIYNIRKCKSTMNTHNNLHFFK